MLLPRGLVLMLLGGLLAGGLAAFALLRWDIAQRREAFQAEARTAHRLLSQRAAELEAVLGLLRVADPALRADAAARLQALYPEVRALAPPAAGAEAAASPGGASGPLVALQTVDAAARRFTLLAQGPVRPSPPVQPALTPGASVPPAGALATAAPPLVAEIDLDRWLAAAGWPLPADGPVAARLVGAGQALVLAPGGPARGVTPGFVFAKPLGAWVQPFELRLQRATGPADWPWPLLGALLAGGVGVAALAWGVLQQRQARWRAEALLRHDRLARLNTLGEMAAGLAHELNQPLTAVLASTQAARRLLPDDPAPDPALRESLDHAVAQTRRAADIVARLRQRVGHGPGPAAAEVVDLRAAVARALALLGPELRRTGVTVQGPAPAEPSALVRADPVALDQILHNLLRNALQALADQAPARRRIVLSLSGAAAGTVLRLRDHGPGLPPEVAARLFQPFNSSRPEGLGLGLSLCATLAEAMDGRLATEPLPPGEPGTVFRLELPTATPMADPAPGPPAR